MSDEPSGAAAVSSSRRLVAFAAAVVLLVVALGAVALVRSRPTYGPPVAVIGDSITEMSQPTLRTAIRPEWDPTIVGRSGYRVGELQADAEDVVEAQPEQAIVNLGTNDVLQGYPLDASMEDYRRLLDTFAGARCIHVVTVNEAIVSADGAAERAEAFNERLRVLAEERDLEVIDWSGAVRRAVAEGEPDGAVLSDTVHPTRVGQRLLGDLYADALARC